ncbi:MAG: phosphatase PAP2 family protein, partial [Bacteroidales bacterium]
MIELLKQWDTDLFLFLNGWHNDFWDVIMYYSSEKLTWIPLYIIILYLIIRHFRWKSIWILIFVAFLIATTDLLSVHAFKNVFLRLRPCHEPSLDGLVHTVHEKCGGQFGFVSSHAI